MLRLGERDAAQRASRDRCRSARGAAAPPAPGTSPASAIAIRPVASPNWLNRSSALAALASMWSSGSKSSTCAATCERNGDGSKRSMRFTGRATGPQARRGTPAGRSRSPSARRCRSPRPAAAHRPVAIAQGVRRRRPVGRERFGEGLERGERPPGDGPREARVDQRRRTPGQARAGSRARSRPGRPPAAGSIVQVTSIPFVAPATWTNRRRRVAGSCQVRLRHVTGIPRPSSGTNGRRAMKSHTRRVAVVADRDRPRVVGEQPLPARDVARQPVDELRRRRDVDADRRCASAARRRARAHAEHVDARQRVEVAPRGSRPPWSVEPPTSSRSSPPVAVARYRMPDGMEPMPADRLVRLHDARSRIPASPSTRIVEAGLLGDLAADAVERGPRRSRGRRPGAPSRPASTSSGAMRQSRTASLSLAPSA